jgi:hypothetical protein
MSRKSTIKDEADATVREGQRQAALERERVIDAAAKAESEAKEEATKEAAAKTFKARFLKFWGGGEQ